MKCVTEKFRHIIAQLDAHGICIDFCVFACGPEAQEKRESEYIDETFRLIAAKRRRHARAMRAGSMPDRDDFFIIDRRHRRLTGAPITWETFIGTEDALPKRIAKDVWSIPEIDGFKTGFINPPHGRSESAGATVCAVHAGGHRHAGRSGNKKLEHGLVQLFRRRQRMVGQLSVDHQKQAQE